MPLRRTWTSGGVACRQEEAAAPLGANRALPSKKEGAGREAPCKVHPRRLKRVRLQGAPSFPTNSSNLSPIPPDSKMLFTNSAMIVSLHLQNLGPWNDRKSRHKEKNGEPEEAPKEVTKLEGCQKKAETRGIQEDDRGTRRKLREN